MADAPGPSSNQTESNSMTDREFVQLLISLYRDLPELWKINAEGYLNKDKRKRALQKMLSVLQTHKPDFDGEKLKKKINVLRTNFNKEYHKNEQRRSAYGSDDAAEPSLWYYNDLLFIKDDQEESAQSKKQKPQKLADKSPTTSKAVQREKKRKPSYNPTMEENIFVAEPNFKMPRYERDAEILDVLAKSWALKLGRLAPDQKCFAEKIINDTLFEAEMGTLTRNGVCFLRSSGSRPKSESPSWSS